MVSGGYGYKSGDTVTLPGSGLGGSSPTNDLTLTLGGSFGNVTNIVLDSVGSNYSTGNTITIGGNVLGGSVSTNNLTFAIQGNVNNYIFGNFTGYSANTVITGSWNGSTLFVNDEINPPMYLTSTATEFGIFDYGDPQTGQTYVWRSEEHTSELQSH